MVSFIVGVVIFLAGMWAMIVTLIYMSGGIALAHYLVLSLALLCIAGGIRLLSEGP